MNVLSVPAVVLLSRLIPATEKLVEIGLGLGLTVVVAFVLQRALFLLVGRLERLIVRHGHDSRASMQRARTLGQIFRHLVTVIVGGAAIIHMLQIIGWDVKPLLAGAGIIGVALGFGAQTLVRDVIAGVFILAENQYSVGDLIEINGKGATVEALTVRSTMLRDFNGYVHFVPNGEMKIVTNRSRDWNRIAVDVVIAADQSIDDAIAVCRKALESFNADAAWRGRLLDPVELWGVESVSGQEATLRCVVRSIPGPGAPEAARELRRQLHRALAHAGIRVGARNDLAAASAAAVQTRSGAGIVPAADSGR